MPINLKELFIADSNQIRIEKINYNFDQIIAVGGQIGPKGQKGDFGPIGPEGEKGQKGEQGPIGVAGSDGADGINYWAEIDHASVNGLVTSYNASILKPVTFGKAHVTALYLGDPDYSITNEGNINPRSVLTIDKDSQFENHFKLVGRNTNLVMRSEYFIDPNIYGGDVFSIKKDDVTGSNPAKLDVAFNDIVINATGNSPKGVLNLTSNNIIELTAANGVLVAPGTVTNFNDRVFVNSNLIVTGSGFTKISSGTTTQRNAIAEADLSGGCIRYNTTTNKLEARYSGIFGGSAWLPLRELTDSDQDTRIEIPITSDEDVITLFTNGNQAMRIGGTTVSLTSTSAPTSNLEVPIITNYAIVAQKNIHINSFGKGLSFKQGSAGNNPAPNSQSPIERRTIDDYFERSTGFFNYDDINWVPASGNVNTNFANDFSSNVGFGIDDAIITNSIFKTTGGAGTVGAGNITCMVDASDTMITYTKIGNMITASAHIRFSETAGGYTFGNDNTLGDGTSTGQLEIKLPGILNKYECLNLVEFPVQISGVYLNGLSLDETTSFVGSLSPGSTSIKLYGTRLNATSIQNNRFSIRSGSFSRSELQTLTVNFTFTYFTEDQSYEQPPVVSNNVNVDPI